MRSGDDYASLFRARRESEASEVELLTACAEQSAYTPNSNKGFCVELFALFGGARLQSESPWSIIPLAPVQYSVSH